VGGDFYDFIALPGGQTVFVIADVAGKGVPGALLMASARAGLRAYVERTHEPREILHRLNLSLCHDARSGQFVSLFCAVLSHDRKRMRFTNAGHNPPLLLRSGAATELEDGGLVLGADESEQYEQQEIELRGGDLVVFYTDGITEAVNGDEEFFDTDGLLEAVRGSPEASAEQMIRNIKAAVDEFSDYRPQADDITMIVLRVE
jgi:sigma-B regulation protein RsbU (phosphoserine phosphatase)